MSQIAAARDGGSQEISFVVYGAAVPAGSKRPGRTSSGRLFVRDDSGARGANWRRQIAQTAGEAVNGAELLIGPLALEIDFYVPRPKSHSGARGLRPSAPAYPTTRPDCLKLARAVEDACTGIVWRDDAQIVHETLSKRYGEPARAEVRVLPL